MKFQNFHENSNLEEKLISDDITSMKGFMIASCPRLHTAN